MAKIEQFSSRWALLLATLGMAIGAGNIWRFPRLAGEYGGVFLIPWAFFLILWSVPLIMVEFALGKKTRKGPIGAFADFLGKKYTWMGGFVTLCTMGIMFYYSVVTGWALKYFLSAASGALNGVDHTVYWDTFTSSGIQPVMFHLVSITLASVIIYQGILNGIERANRILLPSLLLLLIVGAVRSLTLDGSSAGLEYFFGFKTEALYNYKMWLETLSQSAWSTGAGWGLVLTYSVYMREKEDITLNSFLTGFGNNSASLLAGLVIVPAVFALAGTIGAVGGDLGAEKFAAAEAALRAGNEGLGFIVIPQLFSQLPASTLLTSFFFLALFFAALSSLIAMMELSTRMLMDFGFERRKALPVIAVLCAVLGIPSAYSMTFFKNQDWVWGLGLIISGSFFAFAAIKTGVNTFRETYLNRPENNVHVGRWFNVVMGVFIPIEAAILMLGWFYREWDVVAWWDPTRPFSLATCLLQWGTLIVMLLIFNSWIYDRVSGKESKA